MAEPAIKVSGDAKGGFIVEMHDGDRFECFVAHAESEDAVRHAALNFWDGPPKGSAESMARALGFDGNQHCADEASP